MTIGIGRAATANLGAVGLNTNTGYYLLADGSYSTTGEIRVGSFSQTYSQLADIITGWGTSAPTYDHYTKLLSYFTEVGIGGTHGSVVPGWSFGTNGAVSGTSTGVDTSVIPVGTDLYVWAFNITNFASANFNAQTQWGLFTGGTNAFGINLWRANGATTSLVVNQITPQSVLIGTDLSPNSSSVVMVKTSALTNNQSSNAVIGTITSAFSGTNAIITGGSTNFNVSVANSAVAGSDSLNASAAAASNTIGSITGITAAAGATSSNYSGLSYNGTTVGTNKTGTFTVADTNPNVASGTGTVTVNVYDHASGSLTNSTISLGNLHVGYSNATASVNVLNAAGYRVNLAADGLSSGNVSLGSISGVTAGSSGAVTATLAPSQSVGAISNSFTYTFKDNSPLNGASANVGSSTITVTGGVYNYAAAGLGTTSVDLGNIHVGNSFGTSALSITNTAAAGSYTEGLNAAATPGGLGNKASVNGTVVNLAGGAVSTSIVVGLDNGSVLGGGVYDTAGLVTGSVNVGFASSGSNSGLSNTILGSQNVSVTGGVYNYAAAGLTTNVDLGNVHVGDTFSATGVAITNTAASTYSDVLNGTVASSSGASATGSISGVAGQGSSSAITVGITGAQNSAGAKGGTVGLSFSSDGTAAGLGLSSLGSQTIIVSGGVYNYAAAGLGTTNIDLGNIHVGNSFGTSALSITNTTAAGSYTEGLDVAAEPVDSGNKASASGTINNLAGGAVSTNISVGLGNGSVLGGNVYNTAGQVNGSVKVGFVSSGINSGLSNTVLGSQTVTVTGGVYNYAAAGFGTTSVDLGNIHAGGSFSTNYLSVTNTVTIQLVTSNIANTFTTPGSYTWVCPSNVTSVQIECWGAGGAGGSANKLSSTALGGGGAGGAYAKMYSYPVTPGTTYYLNVGSGGVPESASAITNNTSVPGGDSWFNSTNAPSINILAKGGAGGNAVTSGPGLGGTGSTNGSLGDLVYAGGSGAAGYSTTLGGGGGGSGGTSSAGNSATNGSTNGATAVTGGGNGGNPNTSGSSGVGQTPSIPPGGGGGGSRAGSSGSFYLGGNGAAGRVIITVKGISSTVTPGNLAASGANGYVETLAASFANPSGVSTSGSVSGLNNGSSSSALGVTIADNTAGAKIGTTGVAFTSQAIASGLSDSSLGSSSITVSGFVYTGQGVWNAGSGSWSTFANWQQAGGTPGLDGALSANDTATFGTGGSGTIALDGASPSISSLTFSNASASYVVAQGSGGSLSLLAAAAPASINTLAGSHSITAPLVLGSDVTFYGESASLLSVSGIVSGSGALIQSGSGTLALTGVNTYSGGTLVSEGTLFGNACSIQGSVTNNATVVFNQSSAGTYSGNMSGIGALVVSGNGGALTLSGNNSYSGGTAINSNASVIGNTASLTGNIANNGALTFHNGSIGSYDGVISGTGSLAVSGSAAVTLNAASTYTGATEISNGATLALGASGSLLNSSEIKLGTLQQPGTLDLTSKSAYEIGVGQTLSGSGTVSMASGGTVNLNGSVTPGFTSPGIQSFNGNVVFGNSATTTMVVDGGSNGTTANSSVKATGSIAYAGGLLIQTTSSFWSLPDGPYTFNLFTAGTQTGVLSSINLAGAFTGSFTFNAGSNDWTLNDNGAHSWDFNQLNGTLAVTVPTPTPTPTPAPPSGWTNPVGARYTAMIYAQVLDATGNRVTNAGSMLGVFDGTTCAGVANPSAGPNGTLFQLTVYANQTPVSGMTYRFFNGATGAITTLAESYNFVSSGISGSIDNPITLHMVKTQSVPLNEGWTWISFNILSVDGTWDSLLANYAGSDNDVIIGTKGSSTYYGGHWWSSSPDFTPEAGVMYLIGTSKAFTLTATGYTAPIPVNFNLVTGWNWIGCPDAGNTTLLEMMPGMSSSNNDLIISQAGLSATFYGGIWYTSNGSSSFPVSPGKGYHLYHNGPAQTVPLQ